MDMKSLFKDFKNYVDAMDSNDIQENIQEAIQHSINSHILDGQIDENQSSSKNVSTQQVSIVYRKRKAYAFSSVVTSCSCLLYTSPSPRDCS